MRDINKNKIIVNNKNHKRLIGSEQRANEKVNYNYSEKKS